VKHLYSLAALAALTLASCGSDETKAAAPAGSEEAKKAATEAAKDINAENAEAETEKLQKEIESDN
jgi:hypothetical protein